MLISYNVKPLLTGEQVTALAERMRTLAEQFDAMAEHIRTFTEAVKRTSDADDD